MSKVGPILALIGGSIMVLLGIIALIIMMPAMRIISQYQIDLEQEGINIGLMYLNIILTFVWGLLAIIGAIINFKNKKGAILVIISGAIAIVGTFLIIVPAKSVRLGNVIIYFNQITLNRSLLVDPILILIGGIIGLVKPPPEKTKYGTEKKSAIHGDGMTRSMRKSRAKYGGYQ